MVLLGNRIILRPFQKEDAKEYLNIINDNSIKKYVPYAFANDLSSCTELIECYAAGDFVNDFYFIIEHAETHQILGSLICTRTLSSYISISYLIGKDFRGNEFVVEALKLFIDYLSKNTNYKYLTMIVNNKNIASQKIIKKIDAKKYTTHSGSSYYLYRIKSAK